MLLLLLLFRSGCRCRCRCRCHCHCRSRLLSVIMLHRRSLIDDGDDSAIMLMLCFWLPVIW